MAVVPIGAVSSYSGLTAIDMMGLTDGHIAHRKMSNMGEDWAGHEKHDGQYILSRKPTYLLLGNIDVSDRPRDPSELPFIPYHLPRHMGTRKGIRRHQPADDHGECERGSIGHGPPAYCVN